MAHLTKTNPMIYRVILTPNPNPKSSSFFIKELCQMAWNATDGVRISSLDEQVKLASIGSEVLSKRFDEIHYTIEQHFSAGGWKLLKILDIGLMTPEVVDKYAGAFTYEAALKAWREHKGFYADRGKEYTYINATSEGDRQEAERLARIVCEEEVR